MISSVTLGVLAGRRLLPIHDYAHLNNTYGTRASFFDSLL